MSNLISPLLPGDILVVNGNVTCLDSSCPLPSNCQLFQLNGGTIIPGLVESMSHIGHVEVGSEKNAQDGVSSIESPYISAIDGITFQSRHVQSAWAGGINTVITSPQGSLNILGQSVAFHTCCGVVVYDVLLKSNVSLHFSLGVHSKFSGSVSEQFNKLRIYFQKASIAIQGNATSSNDPFILALQGQIPVVAHIHQADVIASILRLQSQFPFQLIIVGGAEAHVIANKLANPSVSVILKSRVPPDDFDTQRSSDSAIKTLVTAGVKVGLAVDDTDNVRNLRWEAGFAVEAGLSFVQALAAITSNVADLFGINSDGTGRIFKNFPANFLAYDGNPFTLQSKLQLNAMGSNVACQPKQR